MGSVRPEKYSLAECHFDHAPDEACLLLKFGPDERRADFFNTNPPSLPFGTSAHGELAIHGPVGPWPRGYRASDFIP